MLIKWASIQILIGNMKFQNCEKIPPTIFTGKITKARIKLSTSSNTITLNRIKSTKDFG